ncbi:MAG: thioredoxin [Spirochaetales bacterium]|nr:thioredoxin [Spirochaetales bacterium]
MEHLTLQSFKEKICTCGIDGQEGAEWKYKGDLPCLIDFYADWCAPCKRLAPVLEELAEEYKGKVYIYKVNTEDEQELSAMFGIQSIPTLLFVPLNDKPQLAAGAPPKPQLIQTMKDVLKI